MKVLSIDFDYFQQADISLMRRYYPEGVDVPPEVSGVIWTAKYIESKGRLKNIKIKEDELKYLKDLLLYQDKDIPVVAALSHVSIVEHIERHLGNEKLYITNIDEHPDVSNDNPALDCGNWIGYLSEKHKTSLTWVADTDILNNIFLPKEDELSCELKKIVLSSISGLEREKYDMVFLCRSDAWLPPHLDCRFSELVGFMKELFWDFEYDEEVLKEREYYESLKN